MAKDKAIPSNIVLAKEKFKYDTIQDMVNDIALKVGMVVDINGYYKPDDGATHKRVIANEDDGSGVQLRNGKWANIVHNGEVNVNWFGAKGDGVTDDTVIFKKAISYTEKNGYKLTFLKRKYYITSLVTFYGDYDFNGATIKIIQKDSNNTTFLGFYGYNFTIEDTTLTLEEINTGDFSKLKSYGDCKVYIESSDIFLAKRNHPLGKTVYKFDFIIASDSKGQYQLFKDYTNITRLDLIRIDNRQKYVKNLNLEITLNENVSDTEANAIVKFWRYDNTFVDNVSIKFTNNNIQNKPTTVIEVVDTYNIEFNKINSETIRTTAQGTYIFAAARAAKMKINNSYIYNKDEKEYWGATGTNLVKDFWVKDTTINRVDSHTFGGGSYKIENSDVKIINIMGDMDLIIENSKVGTTSFRSDYNNYFTGSIFVKDTIFENSSAFLISHADFFGTDTLFNCGKIYLENVYFINKNAFILECANVKNINIPDIEINGFTYGLNHMSFLLLQQSKDIKIKNKTINLKLKRGKINNANFKIINTLYENFDNIFLQNFILNFYSSNINNLSIRCGSIKNLNVISEDCEIVSIDTLDGNRISNVSLKLISCHINPIVIEDISRDSSYQLNGVKYLLFDNCKFEIPQNITPDKAPTSHRLSFLNSIMIECPTEYINCEYTQTTLDYLESKKSDSKYNNMIAKFLTGANALPKYKLRYFSKKIKDSIEGQVNAVAQLNTPYHTEKMKQEGVYEDFIMYMDEKTAYDKQQRKLEQDRQFAYEEALKENPELTYEEFMSVQPMLLNIMEEPQPSQALQDFMEKYL